MNCLPPTAYRLPFTALRPKYLLSFFATFCAIAVTVVSLSSPCRAEQEGTAPDAAVHHVEPSKKAPHLMRPVRRSRHRKKLKTPLQRRKSLSLKGVKGKRKGQAPESFH
jgi:hypothetical protein